MNNKRKNMKALEAISFRFTCAATAGLLCTTQMLFTLIQGNDVKIRNSPEIEAGLVACETPERSLSPLF